MKKLSVLIALVLCVTIGGVYAAWTYTNPDADITDEYFNQLITISAATQEGAAGEYAIETNITGMSIDQKGTNSENVDFHKAILNYTTSDGETPYIKFTLKLKENTGSDIQSKLQTKYAVNLLDIHGQYKDTDIFTDHVLGETVIDWNSDWQYDAASDTYSFTIDNMDSEITLNDFTLSSKPEHTAFHTALGKPVLEVKITDGIVPASN